MVTQYNRIIIPHKVNKGIFQISPTPESHAKGDAEARSADISATSTPGKSSFIGTESCIFFMGIFTKGNRVRLAK